MVEGSNQNLHILVSRDIFFVPFPWQIFEEVIIHFFIRLLILASSISFPGVPPNFEAGLTSFLFTATRRCCPQNIPKCAQQAPHFRLGSCCRSNTPSALQDVKGEGHGTRSAAACCAMSRENPRISKAEMVSSTFFPFLNPKETIVVYLGGWFCFLILHASFTQRIIVAPARDCRSLGYVDDMWTLDPSLQQKLHRPRLPAVWTSSQGAIPRARHIANHLVIPVAKHSAQWPIHTILLSLEDSGKSVSAWHIHASIYNDDKSMHSNKDSLLKRDRNLTVPYDRHRRNLKELNTPSESQQLIVLTAKLCRILGAIPQHHCATGMPSLCKEF